MGNINELKNKIAVRQLRPMSPQVAEIRTNINLMVETMKSVMKDKVHYGVIPGVDKPSLFKAGAEKIMAIFKLSAFPKVEDLSSEGEIRFRVVVEIKTREGASIGEGVGECSSGEEKYSWRSSVCDKEYDSTIETHRRIKYKKDKFAKEGYTEIKQVRVSPSDMANTILKMAKKRALIDGVLTATGASDIFAQDLEDLPEEYIEDHLKREAVEADLKEKENEQTKEQSDFHIKDCPIGQIVKEFECLVVGTNTRTVKVKDGSQKEITAYKIEDSEGKEFVVEKWGGVREGVSPGVLVVFKNIKVGEFKGEKQFLANEVEVA